MANRTGNILDAITQLTPLFLGTGKTSATQNNTVAGSANPQAIKSLIDILHSNAANPNAAGGIVKNAQANAINLMLQKGVPQIASAERGMGIFNSSQTQQAMSQLEGQTAAAAAQMEVDQTNKAAETATKAASTLGQLTPTETVSTNTTQKTAPVVDPLMAALGIGGLFLGNKLLKGFGSDSSGQTGGGAGDVPQLAVPDFTPVTKSPDISNLLDLGGFTKSFATDIAGALKESTPTNPTTGEQSGGANELLNALSGVATSGILDTIGSFFSGLFGGGSSDSSNTINEPSSGGCFITTAACQYQGKADDCDELQTLRAFRDSYMMETIERRELIDQYYREAPEVIKVINTIPCEQDKQAIYDLFYNAYIVPAVEAIKHGDNEHALQLYTNLFANAKVVVDRLLTGE